MATAQSKPTPEQPETNDTQNHQEKSQSYNFIAHPEFVERLSSTRNSTTYYVASTLYAIPQSPETFKVLNITPPQKKLILYECTFLSRHALHVRFGLGLNATKDDEISTDPPFPPARVRNHLCTGFFHPDSNAEVPEGKERLACGLEKRGVNFNTWVNPHLRGGMEYQFVVDEDGNMGLEGFYNHHQESIEAARAGADVSLTEEGEMKLKEGRRPLWKNSTRGPFSEASMPSGVAEVNGQQILYELFEFAAGEDLYLKFIDRDVEGGQKPKVTEEGDERTHENQDLFFWTGRGWGCLVKNCMPIKVDWQSRLQGQQIMLSIRTKSPEMEYIIVAGEALEKLKSELYHEHSE